MALQIGPLASNPAVPPSWYNVKDYGAVGDNSHDDATAIQTAFNALKATVNSASGHSGGQALYFPQGFYKVGGGLNFSGVADVHFIGHSGRGGWRTPSNPGVAINYTGGGSGAAIDLSASQSCVWNGVSLWANGTSFTGTLLKLDTATASDVFGHRVQNCQMRILVGSGTLLSMAGNIEASCDNVSFLECGSTGTQVRMVDTTAAAHWSNANSFRSCSFTGARQYSILNPGHQTTLFDCTFEPGQTGGVPSPIAYTAIGNEPASGLTLVGCGFWDNTGSTGSWLQSSVATDSFVIIGGNMACSSAAAPISLSAHTGLSIQGVNFNSPGGGTPNVFDAAHTITNGSMLGCKVTSPVVDNHTSVFV